MMSPRSTLLSAFAVLAAVAGFSAGAQAQLTNGGFETPHSDNSEVNYYTDGVFPGWHTTASDHQMEIWSNGFNGVDAYEGTQFAELNAFEVSTLFQDVSGISAGQTVGFQFAHRGRIGVDVMEVSITDSGADNTFGTGDDTLLFSKQYSDDETAWGFYTSATEAPITTLGNSMRFAYDSISSVGGPTVGNFLDAADFGLGVAASPTPEPGSLALLTGLGLTGLGLRSRRRRRRNAS